MNNKKQNSNNNTTNISIDVTQIVKYSCVTTVFIVLIVFTSNLLKPWFNHSN